MPSSLLHLKNAILIDGTGAPPCKGDILIVGDRIIEVGLCTVPPGTPVVDCTGWVVCPGFIDAHSHSDLHVLKARLEKTQQGVTSEVVGNCGFSPYPTAGREDAVRKFANGILCGDERWGWGGATAYLKDLAQAPNATAYSLIGHGSMRVAVAGNEQRSLTTREMDRMEQLLEEALTAGAIGMSTGLMYAPGSCADADELECLCRIVARHNKIYATHMRSYSFGLEEAVEEQLDLARRTGCRLQISHLQAVGRPNWDRQRRVIEIIEQASQEGVDVAFDCYPYTAGNTVLTQLVPQWALNGGTDRMIERLLDPRLRKQIAEETRAKMALPWTDVVLTSVESQHNRWAVGMTLAALAERRALEPADLLLELLIEERGNATMLTFNQNEENLRQVLTHPFSIIITDGLFVHGKGHPRLHGTFPLLLGDICRDRHWLSLQEAIHKVTGKPAARFGLAQRGLLKPGYYADIAIFDATSINSAANYENPDVPPEGIRHILRNGTFLSAVSGEKPN